MLTRCRQFKHLRVEILALVSTSAKPECTVIESSKVGGAAEFGPRYCSPSSPIWVCKKSLLFQILVICNQRPSRPSGPHSCLATRIAVVMINLRAPTHPRWSAPHNCHCGGEHRLASHHPNPTPAPCFRIVNLLWESAWRRLQPPKRGPSFRISVILSSVQ